LPEVAVIVPLPLKLFRLTEIDCEPFSEIESDVALTEIEQGATVGVGDALGYGVGDTDAPGDGLGEDSGEGSGVAFGSGVGVGS
jgi:hypothetical protein